MRISGVQHKKFFGVKTEKPLIIGLFGGIMPPPKARGKRKLAEKPQIE